MESRPLNEVEGMRSSLSLAEFMDASDSRHCDSSAENETSSIFEVIAMDKCVQR